MSGYVKIGRREDYPPGRGHAVSVLGKRVAVFSVDGVLRAIQDDCPHMGASLAEGKPEGGQVECHWHGWVFDLATGQGLPPSKSWACVRVYEVKLEGEDVWVKPPDPSPDPPKEEWTTWDDRFLK
jgi:nitrite reductase (NADH) small subunit